MEPPGSLKDLPGTPKEWLTGVPSLSWREEEYVKQQIKKSHPETVVLVGTLWQDNILVSCPFCSRVHIHGAKATVLSREGDTIFWITDRVSHCLIGKYIIVGVKEDKTSTDEERSGFQPDDDC